MGLHILGPDYERDPPADPAFPPGSTLYAREMASRITHSMTFWDQIIGCTKTEYDLDPYPYRFPEGEARRFVHVIKHLTDQALSRRQSPRTISTMTCGQSGRILRLMHIG